MRPFNQQKTISGKAAALICELIDFVLSTTVQVLVWLSRKVWKRYLGIETPLYRAWHKHHVAYMQKKLDNAHSLYSNF